MTLIEVAVAMPIVFIAMGMLIQLLFLGSDMRSTGRETWAASSAAQTVLEQMRGENFRDIVRMYNADPFDDLSGPGTSPGHLFDVVGLEAIGGPVGEVILPIVNTGTEVVPIWEVRENMLLPELSMPRDLSGDAVVDDADHAGDYTFLPIQVRVTWKAPHGVREFNVLTSLTEER